MKDFRVEAVGQTEFEEAAGWYETQRDGLGFEFVAELDRVLMRIAHEEKFATSPIATVEVECYARLKKLHSSPN